MEVQHALIVHLDISNQTLGNHRVCPVPLEHLLRLQEELAVIAALLARFNHYKDRMAAIIAAQGVFNRLQDKQFA